MISDENEIPFNRYGRASGCFPHSAKERKNEKTGILLLLLLMVTGPALAKPGRSGPLIDFGHEKKGWSGFRDCEGAVGLFSMESKNDFQTTLQTLKNLIEQNSAITLMAEVDHRQNALNAGLEQIPPTTLLIFRNPVLGTPLMRDERTAAIDLPQKKLVWEDEDGEVRVAYNDPFYLKWRHGIEDLREVLLKMANALHDLATQATAQ